MPGTDLSTIYELIQVILTLTPHMGVNTIFILQKRKPRVRKALFYL